MARANEELRMQNEELKYEVTKAGFLKRVAKAGRMED